MASPKLHPLVRDLYKRYILAGRDYPTGLASFRELVKQSFRKNAHLTNEEDIIHTVARGRWYLSNEIIPVIRLRKYRTMRARYGNPDDVFVEPAQPPIFSKGLPEGLPDSPAPAGGKAQ
eukprot:m.243052 g.243052  ORF g.243052 m.243052 type:complete len:119 (+) comp14157_c0_seq1:49-405(+)